MGPNQTWAPRSLYHINPGSTTTDRDKLTASKLTADNADWLKRAILNIFLLSPEPSCPNPHFMTKSLRRNQRWHHSNEIVASQSVCSRSVDLARKSGTDPSHSCDLTIGIIGKFLSLCLKQKLIKDCEFGANLSSDSIHSTFTQLF